MKRKTSESEAYRKLTAALKRQPKGATAADLVARTALPLETVRELLPAAADEYAGRLEVTESGEVLYSFPQGFTSRYRGAGVVFRKALRALGKAAAAGGKLFFKVWIMVMLVGYFALFMLLALAALALSVAGSTSGNGRGRRRGGDGGLFFVSGIFNTIVRIWFYSELLKPRYGQGVLQPEKPKGSPLYKAIFSFVFGDGDPNALWEEQEKKAVIAFIQARSGVISSAEFAALSGRSWQDADQAITAYCAEFGGVPEITPGGTIVYRFDDLLRRRDTRDRSFGALSGPLKRLASFSSNEKKLNIWFSVLNGVNLLFGGYFLYNATALGAIFSRKQITGFTYFYAVVYQLFSGILRNPLGVITLGLGLVPLVFSVLFWAVPALRFFGLKKNNETVKMENFRKQGYARLWQNPFKVNPGEIAPQAPECRPRNPAAARDWLIKETAAQWPVDVESGGAGVMLYSFPEMEREKRELENYRAGLGTDAPDRDSLGKTIFDTGA